MFFLQYVSRRTVLTQTVSLQINLVNECFTLSTVEILAKIKLRLRSFPWAVETMLSARDSNNFFSKVLEGPLLSGHRCSGNITECRKVPSPGT